MVKVVRVTTAADNQSSELFILPGNFNGSVEARNSITETGEYFLINTFSFINHGNDSTKANHSGSETTKETTPPVGMESGNTTGQQKIQQGSADQKQASSKKESSTKKESGKTIGATGSKTASKKSSK